MSDAQSYDGINDGGDDGGDGGYDGGSVTDTASMPWRDLAPGVGLKVLRLDRATGAWTIMIKSSPGSVLPPHRHLAHSEIYILSGSGHHDQTGAFKAGDFVVEPDGAMHSPLVFTDEVVQIMTAQGPSQFFAEDGSPTFLMDVNMLSAFADEQVLARA